MHSGNGPANWTMYGRVAWHGGAGCMSSASSHSGRGELLLKVRSSVIMRSVSFPLYTKHVRTTRVGTGSECLRVGPCRTEESLAAAHTMHLH